MTNNKKDKSSQKHRYEFGIELSFLLDFTSNERGVFAEPYYYHGVNSKKSNSNISTNVLI